MLQTNKSTKSYQSYPVLSPNEIFKQAVLVWGNLLGSFDTTNGGMLGKVKVLSINGMDKSKIAGVLGKSHILINLNAIEKAISHYQQNGLDPIQIQQRINTKFFTAFAHEIFHLEHHTILKDRLKFNPFSGGGYADAEFYAYAKQAILTADLALKKIPLFQPPSTIIGKKPLEQQWIDLMFMARTSPDKLLVKHAKTNSTDKKLFTELKFEEWKNNLKVEKVALEKNLKVIKDPALRRANLEELKDMSEASRVCNTPNKFKEAQNVVAEERAKIINDLRSNKFLQDRRLNFQTVPTK